MLNSCVKRWLVRRVRLKLFSVYLFFTLTIYLFLCLNQIELKETSLPWYQQAPHSKRTADDLRPADELLYFASDQYVDKKLSTIKHKIEKHLLQMESKLVKSRNDNSTEVKIAIIKYNDVNNLNFLYRKLLQLNGYQVFLNANISDWTVSLDMNHHTRDNRPVKCSQCSSIRYINRLNNLSILYSNRAYLCAAFSVIYKEINELNKFNKATTSCFVLPEQKLEFEEVAIALGKNIDWLVKKSTRHVIADRELEYIKNSQQTNRIINEKVWNLGNVGASTRKYLKNKMKQANLDNQINNQIDNHLRGNYFDTDFNHKTPVNRPQVVHFQDYVGESIDNSLKHHIHLKSFDLLNESSNGSLSKSIKAKRVKDPSNRFNDFNADSIQFAIEIIDSLSGKVFRSNHHSNDILKSINFQNFELQKMNNSMVYVQKSDEENVKIARSNQSIKKVKKSKYTRTNDQFDQPFILRLFTQRGKKFLDQFAQFKSIEKMNGKTTIVEKKINNLFRINNDTISIRQYVLIKNINPLRAYLFNEGLVFFMQNTTLFKPKTGYWLFSHLRNYFEREHPANTLYSNLIEVISKFLLITEFHLISDFKFLERFQFFKYPSNYDDNSQFDESDIRTNQLRDQFSDRLNIQFRKKVSKDDNSKKYRRYDSQFVNQLPKDLPNRPCDLKQYQLIELELVLNDKFEFYIVDVNLEPVMFDNRQSPYREFDRQTKKELIAFQKNLLISVWRMVGILPQMNKAAMVKQSLKNGGSMKNRKHTRRSITLKKIKDLPRKYLDLLSKQSSKVRRKLLFVNESSFKHKLINNWQANLFRRLLSRLVIEQNVGIMGLNCLVSHQLCLTQQDLHNILLTNIEPNRNNRFDPLYPSTQMCELNYFVDELSSHVNPTQTLYRTADLHPLLCKLELQLTNSDNIPKMDVNDKNESIDYSLDLKENNFQANVSSIDQASGNQIPYYQTKNSHVAINQTTEMKNNQMQSNHLSSRQSKVEDYNSYSTTNDISSINGEFDETIESINYLTGKLDSTRNIAFGLEEPKEELNCSLKDEDRYLIDLEWKPNLKSNSKYQGSTFKVMVNYSLIQVRLIANARHCNGKIKLNQMISRSVNASLNLGIGLNRIVLHVTNDVDTFDQSKTYQTIIQRLSLEEMSSYDPTSAQQFICQINQNCNFKIYKTQECGLAKVRPIADTTSSIERQLNSSGNRCTGDESGRWLIRCNSCDDLFSCKASSQLWLPYDCTYKILEKHDLEKCFKYKNLLFIGDSTIRGMMHYLIEKLNGTLKSYEKIHNIRIYPNLNLASTTFGFAYYPRFWYSSEMPSLSWTVSKLKSMIKSDFKSDHLYATPQSETVIIIGGVHWLSTKQITKIHGLIQNYSSTRLILKSLGSGFHQNIQSVHYLPIDEQRKLVDHNQNLINLSKQKNIQILDTFNASNVVYDSFFPGSCSCHFYKSSIVNDNGHSSYHISGLINRVFANMMANLICESDM